MAQAKKAKAVPLEIKGDTVTVVRSLPFTVTAGGGADLYFWTYPAGVEATAADGVLTVTKAPQGKHTIKVVSVTIVIDFENKNKRIVRDEGAVEVTVGAVPPGPEPDPPTPPTPAPDGDFGLIKASREGMRQVASTTKAAQAARLAQVQRSHASAVAAGAFVNDAAILEGWRAANRKALSESEQLTWAPWAQAVKARLEEVHKAGKIKGDNAWAAAFNEIAAGLTALSASKKGGK